MNLLQEIQSGGNTTKTESSKVRAEAILCCQWSMRFVYPDQQRIGQSGTVTPDNAPEFLCTYIIGKLSIYPKLACRMLPTQRLVYHRWKC